MINRLMLCAALTAVALSPVAVAQDDEKAEIVVTSFRKDVVTLKYEYVFRTYSWAIMNYSLDAEDEVTYRRPANLPGCKQLKDWGIDQGRFTISSSDKEVCTGPLSICDTTNYAIEVHAGGCKWRRAR